MRKSFSIVAVALLILCSCQESIEERAQREAKEFTQKNCPTPEENMTITDSMVFYPETRTLTTYVRFCGKIDDQQVVDMAKEKSVAELKRTIAASPENRPYTEAGFNFRFVAVSKKDPQKVLLDITLKASELTAK